MSSLSSPYNKKNSEVDIELAKSNNQPTSIKQNKDEQKNLISAVSADCVNLAKNGLTNTNNTSNSNSYSKFTGATTISHLLKMSYSDSTQMSPDLSFPIIQTPEEQMNENNYRFSNAKQGRRNSTIYEKSSQARQTNTRGLSSSQKSTSVSDKPEQKRKSTTNDSFDCNKIFMFL